jgi:hypothetical protein
MSIVAHSTMRSTLNSTIPDVNFTIPYYFYYFTIFYYFLLFTIFTIYYFYYFVLFSLFATIFILFHCWLTYHETLGLPLCWFVSDHDTAMR